MPPPDPRGDALRAFDAHAQDFVRAGARRHQAGAGIAEDDIDRLARLAERLAADLRAWAGALGELDIARHARLDPRRAGQLVVESVFDEVLIPEGTRVLAAALELAAGPL